MAQVFRPVIVWDLKVDWGSTLLRSQSGCKAATRSVHVCMVQSVKEKTYYPSLRTGTAGSCQKESWQRYSLCTWTQGCCVRWSGRPKHKAWTVPQLKRARSLNIIIFLCWWWKPLNGKPLVLLNFFTQFFAGTSPAVPSKPQTVSDLNSLLERRPKNSSTDACILHHLSTVVCILYHL